MERPIRFSFEGKTYEVSHQAYERNLIALPDGTLLEAEGWLERLPPIPTGLHRVTFPTAEQAKEV